MSAVAAGGDRVAGSPMDVLGDTYAYGVDFSNIPAGQQDNVGLDNIRFGQNPPPEVTPNEVPEPAAIALFGVGLAFLGVSCGAKPHAETRKSRWRPRPPRGRPI